MARPARSRRRAYRWGWWAERLAAGLLRVKGYRVLARRFRAPGGEVDLVVRRGGLVVFVEVKARRDPAQAAEAIGERQRRRVARAAEAFVARHPELAGCAMRFDAVLISPWRRPRHIAAAWLP